LSAFCWCGRGGRRYQTRLIGCAWVGCAVQVLTGLMVFVARDSSVQIAVGCLVNLAVLLANIALRPMADPVVRLTRPTL
jgi:cobalamin biosynthesis protein CobD/CbiB